MFSSISKFFLPAQPQIANSPNPVESSQKSLSLIVPDKIKPILKSKVQWRCIQNSDLTRIKKFMPKMLSVVRITPIDSEEIGSSGIRNLCKALSSAKIISSLMIEEREISIKHLAGLLHSTNHLKKLKYSLTTGKYKFSEESIRSLTRIRRFKSLEQFEGILGPTEEEALDNAVPKNRELIHHLSKQLRGLCCIKELTLESFFFIFQIPTSLKSLNLIIDKKSESLEGFQKLASNIQQCRLLETLILDFNGRSFNLNFAGNNIECPEATIWHSLFKKASTLRILKITKFVNPQQQLEAIRIFLNGLKYLKQLTTLDIEFRTNYTKRLRFGNIFLFYLSINLPHLKNLDNLRLNLLAFANIETYGFGLLVSILKQLLGGLKHFHLTVPKRETFKKCVIVSLAKTLEKFKNLQTLTLYALNQDFDEGSMRILMNSTFLKNLTSLVLYLGDEINFRHNDTSVSKKKNNGILSFLSSKKEISFFPNLSQCSLLSHLSLHFEYSALLNVSAVFKELSLSLRKLKQLSSLELNLPVFDSEGLRLVMSSLQDLPNLKSLDARFFGKGLCGQLIQEITSNLAGCKTLENLKLKFYFDEKKDFSDRYLDFLSIGLQELQTLKNLSISIYRVYENLFPGEMLCEFMERLAVLKNLETLAVFCKIEDLNTLLPHAVRGYQNLRNLRSLHINYERYI